MLCATHIIECLRKINIEPEAYESGFESSDRSASQALKYDTSSYFASSDNGPQWLSVNFKRNVSITGYTIKTCSPRTSTVCLYGWNLSVSEDNSTWKPVHDKIENYNTEKSYTLSVPITTKFARIDGNSLHSSYPQEILIHYVKSCSWK